MWLPMFLRMYSSRVGNGGGVPHSDRLRAVAAGVPGMRKAHRQHFSDSGYALAALPSLAPGTEPPDTRHLPLRPPALSYCNPLRVVVYRNGNVAVTRAARHCPFGCDSRVS